MRGAKQGCILVLRINFLPPPICFPQSYTARSAVSHTKHGFPHEARHTQNFEASGGSGGALPPLRFFLFLKHFSSISVTVFNEIFDFFSVMTHSN